VNKVSINPIIESRIYLRSHAQTPTRNNIVYLMTINTLSPNYRPENHKAGKHLAVISWNCPRNFCCSAYCGILSTEIAMLVCLPCVESSFCCRQFLVEETCDSNTVSTADMRALLRRSPQLHKLTTRQTREQRPSSRVIKSK
jgi:hypothetical protein